MERGIENVLALEGGYNRWVDEQRPTDVKPVVTKGCLECHRVATPKAVKQWEASRHSQRDVSCTVCHGEGHLSEEDVHLAEPVTPDRCIQCHTTQVTPFEKGRHARAWDVAQAVESGHGRPVKDRAAACGPCHGVGFKKNPGKTQPEPWQRGWEAAPCTACHGEHRFDLDQARQPETCKACHQGPGQPQWDMVADSPHGGAPSDTGRGKTRDAGSYPTCQTCHMPEGDHLFRTAWGYWGLDPSGERTPDRRLLKALGFLDEAGAWTAQGKRLLDLGCFRSPTGAFRKDRQRMIAVCTGCHAEGHGMEALAQGDRALRDANQRMARALEAAEQQGITGPVLVPTGGEGPIQKRLQEMFFHDRMNRFKGSFHLSPRYSEELGKERMESGVSEFNLSDLPRHLRNRSARRNQ